MKSPHPVFCYRHLIRALNRAQFKHYQKCTSLWIPLLGITCKFDIRFSTLRLVAKAHWNTHTILPPIPAGSPCLTSPSTSSSIHSSDWQLYDTTLHHQASPTFCLCQAARNPAGFACSNNSSSSIWLLCNMISLHRLPQRAYVIWYLWVTGVTELHEKSIRWMSGQLLNTNALKYCNFSQ